MFVSTNIKWTLAVGVAAARRGRRGSATARPAWASQPARPAWASQPARPPTGAAPSRRSRHGVREYKTPRERRAAGRWPALDTTNGGATGYTRQQLRRRTGEGAAVDSEDWSLRPAGPAHPAEPRHSPVRRGTQDKHGWLGQRQWKRQ